MISTFQGRLTLFPPTWAADLERALSKGIPLLLGFNTFDTFSKSSARFQKKTFKNLRLRLSGSSGTPTGSDGERGKEVRHLGPQAREKEEQGERTFMVNRRKYSPCRGAMIQGMVVATMMVVVVR